MTWITFLMSILSFLVQYGPQIAALIKEIFDAIKGVHPSQQGALTAELDGAVKTFQTTGNKRPLLDLLQKVHVMLSAPEGPKAA